MVELAAEAPTPAAAPLRPAAELRAQAAAERRAPAAVELASTGGGGTASTGGGGTASTGGGGTASTGGGGTASTGGGTASTGGGTSGTGGGMCALAAPGTTKSIFTMPEPWTKDVSTLAPAAESSDIIAAFNAVGGWGNNNVFQIDFSIIVLHADGGTPRKSIVAQPGATYCYGGPDCDPVPFTMPIPTNGNTEGSTDGGYGCDYPNNDCHVLVVEHDEQKLYELYNSSLDGNVFSALGAFKWDLTKAYPDNERGDQCTSADAAGFPMAGLMVTSDEVASGEIPHAIRLILPNGHMRAATYVHPASHAGAPSSSNPNAPPYGTRLRLKPCFDETPYNAAGKTILHAMKRYGLLVSDGGGIALTFSDDHLSTNKWTTLGIDSHSFVALTVSDFEVVDFSTPIAVTNSCVRNP